MNILHTVESYPPAVGGMQEVVRQLSERFVKLGHNVTVATSKHEERKNAVVNGVTVIEFDISGNSVRGIRGNRDCYSDLLLNGNFDVITNFAAQQWASDLMFPLLDVIKAKKVFVPTGFSGLYWPQYSGYFKAMPEVMKKYDVNVFLSEEYRDIEFARQYGIEKRVVIPNGAGADEFTRGEILDIRRKFSIPEDHFLILHVGSHTSMKGHAEAITIFRKAQIPHATFLIIANAPGGGCTKRCNVKAKIFNSWQTFSGRSDKRIITASLPREETISAYHQADLFLFPSNIECSPLVLFECMASKTPFLSTDVGNAEEILRWSGGGMLLPTRKTKRGFSKAIVRGSARLLERVYEDPSLREKLRNSGYNAWKEHFSWEKITLDYEALYRDLLDNKGVTRGT